jgi:glycosyltransferase involved in cell wall biosynthesis
MTLTVLNVAFPLAAVGPAAVGGAEQVLSLLDRSLVAAGHRSLVMAAEGSEVAGTHLAIPPPPSLLDRAAWERAHQAQRAGLDAALSRWEVDVVHLHGVDFAHYLPPPGPPALVTLHLPATHYPPAALRPARPHTYLHCVTRSQRALFPPGLALLPEVPNGVDLVAFRPAGGRRGYALAMGRICEAKGFHLALDAARAAGLPLLLAGAVHPFPEHLRYFAQQIRPRLDARRRFLGPVAGPSKARLLAGARCVVVSSLVAETCSLVALEALASGTPVVAFRRGALAEVVEDGRTGFLVETPSELPQAMRACAALSPAACRASAEARFDAARTAARYLDLYRRLALTARESRGPAPGALPAPPPASSPR